MTRQFTFIAFLPVLLLILTACYGPQADVPSAHLGKLSTPDGLEVDIIEPSKFRLDRCPWGQICNNLILVEASDYARSEQLQIFMPKDQLNLDVEIAGIYAVTRDTAEQVFARMSPQDVDPETLTRGSQGRIKIITMDRTYDTYAKRIVQDSARSYLTGFSIEQIMSNREAHGQELTRIVSQRLESTPIRVVQFGLANVQPPGLIITANEENRKRQIEIQKARAEKDIAVERAQARKEIALKQQEVDLIEAKTQVLVQLVLDRSVSPAFIMQRYMRFLETAAKNGNAMFIPFETIQSEGLEFRIFNQDFAEGLGELSTKSLDEIDVTELEDNIQTISDALDQEIEQILEDSQGRN